LSPCNKTPGLLRPFPILEQPWQHISMNFVSFNKDKHGYYNVLVIINRLSKESISIPCHKATITWEITFLFIYHVWHYFGCPDSIVSGRGLQRAPHKLKAFHLNYPRLPGPSLKQGTSCTRSPQILSFR